MIGHIVSALHGLGAALVVLAIFYAAGAMLVPHRVESHLRWPDRVVLGLALYVAIGWAAVSSRNIPLLYVAYGLVALVVALLASRRGWTQSTLKARLAQTGTWRLLLDFGVLYLLSYALIRPPAGDALPLSPDGSIDLVSYARYARHLLEFGTADVALATVDYRASPAAVHVLAGYALLFGRDPLDAAMAALFMCGALFGMIGAEVARSVFGLPRVAAMVVAAVSMCAPIFRWTLTTYSLGEMVVATGVLYVSSAVARAIMPRLNVDRLSAAVGAAAGAALLMTAAPVSLRWLPSAASGFADLTSSVSPLGLLGIPANATRSADDASASYRAAVPFALAMLPWIWAAAAYAIGRWGALERIGASIEDSRLARALAVYAAVGVIIGNIAVQAVRAAEPPRRSGRWRQLGDLSRMSFRALTLRVAEEPGGLSSALAMYYMPGRRTQIFGRGVSAQELSFDTVSKQQPLFIQNFGCQGVGHDDTVQVPGVGCLLLAPPSAALGSPHPFNQTFLFVTYDRMTAREPGGRWNTRPTLHLRLLADPQRLPLDRTLHVNLLVNPFLEPGAKPLRLALQWGMNQEGEVDIDSRQWFSLPVDSQDWRGNRLWAMPIAIDFPDKRTILFHEIALTEAALGETPSDQ